MVPAPVPVLSTTPGDWHCPFCAHVLRTQYSHQVACCGWEWHLRLQRDGRGVWLVARRGPPAVTRLHLLLDSD